MKRPPVQRPAVALLTLGRPEVVLMFPPEQVSADTWYAAMRALLAERSPA